MKEKEWIKEWIIFGRRPPWGGGKTRFRLTGNLEEAAKAADDLRGKGYLEVRFMDATAVQPQPSSN